MQEACYTEQPSQIPEKEFSVEGHRTGVSNRLHGVLGIHWHLGGFAESEYVFS